MERQERNWATELASSDSTVQSGAQSELGEFLRKTLAKGFGRQLSDSDLDEMTQDSLLRVFETMDTFRGESRFTTWAAAIAVNLALGELRRRKFQNVSLDDAVTSGREFLKPADAPDSIRSQQLLDALRTAMEESLTNKQREALHAKLSGMPMAEIARRVETTRGALYKLLHDARQRLRTHLERQGIHSFDLESMDREQQP